MHSLLLIASPFYAFQQSDFLGRLIVVILIGISILAWTIIIEKWHYLKLLNTQCNHFINVVKKPLLPVNLIHSLDCVDGPLNRVVSMGFDAIATCNQQDYKSLLSSIKEDGFDYTFSQNEIEMINSSMIERVDIEIDKMEENLGLLGSIVSVSPFIGLLGTVWGVMMAFTGMALKGKADINAIAPGVSGALLTTVVALIVAIPALISYNQLTYSVKLLSRKLEHFTDELTHLMKVKHLKSQRL